MKKFYLFSSVLLLCSSMTFAQLRVASNGNVGIQIPPTTIPLSPLTIVRGAGDTTSQVSVWNESTNYRMSSRLGGFLYSNWVIPFLGENTVMPLTVTQYYVGVYGLSTRDNPKDTAIAYGVMGQASNATSGYNYGVYGTYGGSSYGAGVVGTTNGNFNQFMDGKYAGYFMGNVKVTGILTASNVASSDSRLKTDIRSLNEPTKQIGVLSSVLSMNPVQYKLKQMYDKSVSGDSSLVSVPVYDEKSQQFQKMHFGLIAQELQKLYPDLVYEGDDGYLGVDYVGLIPILIQSAKELKTEIEVLKSSEASMRSISGIETKQSSSLTEKLTSILYQNTFNPYSHEAVIKYYIPQNINSALLCVYDIQGKQLKEIPLLERGEEGVQTIISSEFVADMYLYGLIVDGKVIDIKQFN